MSINVKIWFDVMKKLFGLKGLKVINCYIFFDVSFSGFCGFNCLLIIVCVDLRYVSLL